MIRPITVSERRGQRLQILVVWLIVAVAMVPQAWSSVATRALRDPDDAGRLLQIRDLLAGQGWWDLTSYRLGTSGVEMHWSRHIDGLVAVPVILLRPIVGAEAAEIISITVVPLGLLLAALWTLSAIGRLLSPLENVGLFAMLIFAFSSNTYGRFAPGALDHHNLQLVLLLLAIKALLDEPARRTAFLAGASIGVSLTVGLETFPVLAAVAGSVAFGWIARANRPSDWYRLFGITLVGSVILSSLLFTPVGRIVSRECDVMALGFLGLVSFPVVALIVFSRWKLQTGIRWLALGGATLLGAAWFSLINPSCLAGPYQALPDRAIELWINQIQEVQGLVSYAGSQPLLAIAAVAGPIVALVFLARLARSGDWLRLLPMIAALLTALGMSLWQIRSLPHAIAVASPALGVAASQMRSWARSDVGRAITGLAAVLVLSGLLFRVGAAVTGSQSESSHRQCLTEDLFEPLDDLPTGRVVADIDVAPALMLQTEHTFVASGYHRGYDSALVVLDMLLDDPNVGARTRAEALEIDYIVVCNRSGWSAIWVAEEPEGLLAALINNDPPPWLEERFANENAAIYELRQ